MLHVFNVMKIKKFFKKQRFMNHFLTGIIALLSLGAFLDIYTYLLKGNVFVIMPKLETWFLMGLKIA